MILNDQRHTDAEVRAAEQAEVEAEQPVQTVWGGSYTDHLGNTVYWLGTDRSRQEIRLDARNSRDPGLVMLALDKLARCIL